VMKKPYGRLSGHGSSPEGREESDLGGGTASRSPFQRFRCLPFSDASKRPATKGSYPLGIPRCFADGQSSEAWNRAAFDSLGQKRRVFEPLSCSLPNGFLSTQPESLFISRICGCLRMNSGLNGYLLSYMLLELRCPAGVNIQQFSINFSGVSIFLKIQISDGEIEISDTEVRANLDCF
jgi:hypothetical protein